MDVIYVGQLSPAWGIRGVSLRKFHEVLPHFLYVQICAEESSKQKDSIISRTDQKSNTKKGSDHYIYPHFYIDFTL